MTLEGKAIVVGISGGIAAYKAVGLVRELGRRGAICRVAMTEAATRFIGPVTLAGISGTPPVTNLWAPDVTGEVHVDLASWADAMVIAPATMNTLARLAGGFADDPVLATAACLDAPLVVAPAMHHAMWGRSSTQRNVDTLREDGVRFAGPVSGPLASGEVGWGRMCEPEEIADALEGVFPTLDLTGRHVLVTAGPTHEDLDPVRYIGNRSTGRMGFALAEAAAARGARVTLVAGPVNLRTPARVDRIDVRSAVEMAGAVETQRELADAIVMTAAVADYRPEACEDDKIKKGGDRELRLVRNPDILAGLGASRSGPTPVLVGFALETREVVRYAREKLEKKGCDLIVANKASDGFGGRTNVATLVTSESEEALPQMDKRALADRILDFVASRLSVASP